MARRVEAGAEPEATASGWITGRNPTIEELSVTYRPSADYEHRSGEFLVTDGEIVTLDTFELPPGTHRETGKPYSGYWRAESSGPKWLGWMPKPSPMRSRLGGESCGTCGLPYLDDDGTA